MAANEANFEKHAAHVMIIAKTDKVLFGQIPMNGFVLMQLRFDGSLGFPGGFVDPGETVVKGLNRELQEEIGAEPGFCEESDLLNSRFIESKNVQLHFYSKMVDEDKMAELEHRAIKAREYGHEVLGHVRVPLYNFDGGKGFNVFLKHHFVGNAAEQLLHGLNKYNLLPQ